MSSPSAAAPNAEALALRQTLRQRLLDERQRFVAGAAAGLAQAALAKHLRALLHELEPQCLGLYWPVRFEFNAVAALAADKAFADALAGFGNDTKGLVLDLRNSPGGLLESGSEIASRLRQIDTIGYMETKNKKVAPIAFTLNGVPLTPITYPIAVLVNGGTANTAEMLAAALQSKGAKIVGSPTFGDASDVKVIQLKDGSGFTMTVGKLMTVTKTDFGGVGIKPDVAVPDAAGSDEPLNRAIGVLAGREARLPSTRG